jgi:uncharacterized secreted repeat protein (TIGR03808 family)
MTTDRRTLLQGTAALMAGAAVLVSDGARAKSKQLPAAAAATPGVLVPDPTSKAEQTAALQAAIERTAAAGQVLNLPAGTYFCRTLGLPSGTQIVGVPGATRLAFVGEGAFIVASRAEGLRLEGLVIDGALEPIDTTATDGLVTLADCTNVTVRDVTFTGSLVNGLSLRRCSGRISDCTVTKCSATAIFSQDAVGLTITGNTISDIGNNGIQVWRTDAGEDGTIVSGNRISRIAARAGGDGPNGNAINVFKAGSVQVSNNRISDCAFSGVRANSASNCQILGNSIERMGEVAIYAEFAFTGAVIANNLVDHASVGISVTNFNEGGRLAVVQGNLIRNLTRASASGEVQGFGISIEADTAVSGNVIEGAERIGIQVGWGTFRRDVSLTGNMVRQSPIGIALSLEPGTGAALVAQNVISGATNGAIRQMDHDNAIGPDLMLDATKAISGLTLSGNVSVS